MDVSGLKGDDLAWEKLSLDHLGGALALTICRKEDTSGIESTIGNWTTRKLFGVTMTYEGIPVSFAVAYQKTPKNVVLVQWGTLAEVEEKTNIHGIVMARFLDHLPKAVTCVSLVVDERDMTQHNAAKAAGFRAISVLNDHFPGGHAGYLFTKRFDNKPHDEEEEECLTD